MDNEQVKNEIEQLKTQVVEANARIDQLAMQSELMSKDLQRAGDQITNLSKTLEPMSYNLQQITDMLLTEGVKTRMAPQKSMLALMLGAIITVGGLIVEYRVSVIGIFKAKDTMQNVDQQ